MEDLTPCRMVDLRSGVSRRGVWTNGMTGRPSSITSSTSRLSSSLRTMGRTSSSRNSSGLEGLSALQGSTSFWVSGLSNLGLENGEAKLKRVRRRFVDFRDWGGVIVTSVGLLAGVLPAELFRGVDGSFSLFDDCLVLRLDESDFLL